MRHRITPIMAIGSTIVFVVRANSSLSVEGSIPFRDSSGGNIPFHQLGEQTSHAKFASFGKLYKLGHFSLFTTTRPLLSRSSALQSKILCPSSVQKKMVRVKNVPRKSTDGRRVRRSPVNLARRRRPVAGPVARRIADDPTAFQLLENAAAMVNLADAAAAEHLEEPPVNPPSTVQAPRTASIQETLPSSVTSPTALFPNNWTEPAPYPPYPTEYLGSLQLLLESSDTTSGYESDTESVDSNEWPEPAPPTPTRDRPSVPTSPMYGPTHAYNPSTGRYEPVARALTFSDPAPTPAPAPVVAEPVFSVIEILDTDDEGDDEVMQEAPAPTVETEVQVVSHTTATTNLFTFVSDMEMHDSAWTLPQIVSTSSLLPSVAATSDTILPSPSSSVSYQPSEDVSNRSVHGHRLRSGKMY